MNFNDIWDYVQEELWEEGINATEDMIREGVESARRAMERALEDCDELWED